MRYKEALFKDHHKLIMLPIKINTTFCAFASETVLGMTSLSNSQGERTTKSPLERQFLSNLGSGGGNLGLRGNVGLFAVPLLKRF